MKKIITAAFLSTISLSAFANTGLYGAIGGEPITNPHSSSTTTSHGSGDYTAQFNFQNYNAGQVPEGLHIICNIGQDNTSFKDHDSHVSGDFTRASYNNDKLTLTLKERKVSHINGSVSFHVDSHAYPWQDSKITLNHCELAS